MKNVITFLQAHKKYLKQQDVVRHFMTINGQHQSNKIVSNFDPVQWDAGG